MVSSSEPKKGRQLDNEYRLRAHAHNYDCIIKEGGASNTQCKNDDLQYTSLRGLLKASMLTIAIS